MGAEEFSLHVKDALDTPMVRSNRIDKQIQRVAVCGGAGGSLLHSAVAAGADALVTGDVKHDLWLEADRLGILLIDAGHFATENVVISPAAGPFADPIFRCAFSPATIQHGPGGLHFLGGENFWPLTQFT